MSKSSKVTNNIRGTFGYDPGLIIDSEKATDAVIKIQNKMQLQRALWDMRLKILKEKYESRIEFLEKQMSSNADLWKIMKT